MKQEIADYDKYDYDYEKYWEDTDVNRDYENQAEIIAIKELLPRSGSWFCDLGAGFGRLFETYENRFSNIILADYSIENLKKAQEYINKKTIKQENNNPDSINPDDPATPTTPNIYFVALNAYHLPFKPDTLSCLLAVRLIHHIEEPEQMISEISRVLEKDGKMILEYANKRHFGEIIRALTGKSKMHPFSSAPSERGDLFYNFHPRYIKKKILNSQFSILKIISVSNLRHSFFKNIFGTKIMLFIDKIFQPFFNFLKFGPSIFILANKNDSSRPEKVVFPSDIKDLFLCPRCGSEEIIFLKNEIRCKSCEKHYPIIDGIYDLRVE